MRLRCVFYQSDNGRHHRVAAKDVQANKKLTTATPVHGMVIRILAVRSERFDDQDGCGRI
jgi:hypothetical protein